MHIAKRRFGIAAGILCLAIGMAGRASASISVAIVESDPGDAPVAQLLATGLFSSVADINVNSSTPTLAQLQGYSAILVYTNFIPANGTALGNVLAQYVNGGGGLVLSTYSFSNPWAIGGQIMTPGYSPLTNVGSNGNVSGALVAAPGQSGNPIFNGVNLSTLTYFQNFNFAHPGLDSGATLLATDGSGINMIAVNSTGKIYADNLFPGSIYNSDQQLYQLLGNQLVQASAMTATPEPSTMVLSALGAAAFIGYLRRKHRATIAA
jgi:hypothetical protein